MSTGSIKNVVYTIVGSMVTIVFILIYLSRGQTDIVEIAENAKGFGEVVTFLGSIIGLLLVVIGFFISLYFKQQTDSTKELSLNIEKLSQTISGMNAVLASYGVRMDEFEKRYEDHKDACDKRFKK